MKTSLTLQEKLRDLRNERKLKLIEVAEATGIPVSTLQRIEGSDDIRAGYQDIATLAQFYNVSTDYLFGLTDNRRHRNIDVDKLGLSDDAIEVLKEKTLNNRLLSEFLSHDDFPNLLRAMEIYIDRKIVPQINTMNKLYKFAEQLVRDKSNEPSHDETLTLLQSMVVDEDDFLRYRISERFNIIMKNMFEAHKADSLADEQDYMLNMVENDLETYKSNENTAKAKMILLAKQIGLNITKLSDEELRVLMKALENSDVYKRSRKPKKTTKQP